MNSNPGLFGRIRRFATEGVWDIEITSLSAFRRAGVKLVRVANLVTTGFKEDQCPMHASALTFNTLMSLVPILAVSFALAKGFGAGDMVEKKSREGLKNLLTQIVSTNSAGNRADSTVAQGERLSVDSGMPVDNIQFIEQIDSALAQVFVSVKNISFAKLGGIGLALLVWSVIQVLGSVESSFNQIWGVKTGRPLHRKVFDYIGVLIVIPILSVAASSLPAINLAVEYTSKLDQGAAEHLGIFLASPTMQYVTACLLVAAAFTFLIMFMPNTRVGFKAGLAGGLSSAILFICWMWICLAIQVGVIKYSKIYGGFAMVPILMFWIYISWEIILLGSQIAFAVQNCDTYKMELRAHTAGFRTRFGLALAVLIEAAKSMSAGGPFDSTRFAAGNAVPVRLLNDVIKTLVDAGLLVEIAGRAGCYTLLRAPDDVTGKDIMDSVLAAGERPGEFDIKALGPRVAEVLGLADNGLRNTLAVINLRTMAVQACLQERS